MELEIVNRACPVLYIVVPCYNEEEVLPETAKRLREKVRGLISAGEIDEKSRILFVNDGSRDRTWEMIETLSGADRLFGGVKLSRNRGHQNALLAGLMTAKDLCDCTISMDADLQDDIGAVDGMLREYKSGSDIVYGVRSSRETDTFFKRFTAEGFYKILQAMGVEIVFNHADYRLMSRRALQGLSSYREVNLFLRGIVPQIGYKSSTVTYARAERFAGESKYPLRKMLALAWDGITSFSVKPIGLAALFRHPVEHRRGGGRHHLPDCPPGDRRPYRHRRRPGLHLACLRPHPHGPRPCGGIYRQDLRRGEGPPAVYH